MKVKRILATVLAMTLLMFNIMGNGISMAAEGLTVVINEQNVNMVLTPGQTHHYKIPIKSVGGYLPVPVVDVKYTGTGDADTLVFSNVNITNYGSTANGIGQLDGAFVEFDVKVKETAVIGKYPITITVSYTEYTENGGERKSTSVNTFFQILEEKAPVQLVLKNVNLQDPNVGCDTNLSFNIRNEGEIVARNAYLSVDYADTGIEKRYSTNKLKIGDIASGKEQAFTLPVTILSSTTPGRKKLKVNFEFKDIDGKPFTSSYDITVNVEKNDAAPRLEVESITYNGEIKAGDDLVLVATLRNYGESSAMDVNVKVDDTSIGTASFIKNYFTDSITLVDLEPNKKTNAKIPLIVSKDATKGVKELKLKINYTDKDGVAYSSTATIYPEIIASELDKGDTIPNIVINEVKQNPSRPSAGGKLEVSFDMVNKSKIDIKEVKIYMDNLQGNTFIPVDSEPYQYIELLKAGEKKRITIPLTISDKIPEGLNNLGLKYTYSGSLAMESVTIPVRNVQNDKQEASSSKPKLIISKYSTNVEELKAGSTFNFIFDIHNTNSSVSAKNITVTVSQAENIFAVTQGSNSFFINKIGPGESVQESLEMKIKSDASTKAYPIDIVIEYEYDGAEPNPQTGEIGEKRTEKLNLQVTENSRPVVDYVNVYSYDGPISVNSAANLAFEFYNMGKSQLNNVIVTVEGDFKKADGNMHFIGNVLAGGSTYAEFPVIPNVEGMAKGTLKVVFEDSNGDEVSMTKEFESFVQGQVTMNDGGFGGPVDDVFAPQMPQPKKPILPIWAFILIQVVIFIAFIPITRKIIISIYKMKLRKKEEENY